MPRRDVIIHGTGDSPQWGGGSPSFPNASNTGHIAAGYTNLTAYTGGNIGVAGTTLTAKTISGSIDVTAANVTFQGCEIIGSIVCKGDAANVRFLDCTFHNANQSSGVDAFVHFQTSGYCEIARCNMYWAMSDPIKMGIGAYYIHHNYIHDNNVPDTGAHVDLMEFWDGPCDGLRIEFNTILFPHGTSNTTTCLMLSPSPNAFQNINVEGNLIGGTSRMIYPPGRLVGGPATESSNCRIVNNHFTQNPALAGASDAVSYRSGSVIMAWGVRGNVWSGNVWHEAGTFNGVPHAAGDTVTPND